MDSEKREEILRHPRMGGPTGGVVDPVDTSVVAATGSAKEFLDHAQGVGTQEAQDAAELPGVAEEVYCTRKFKFELTQPVRTAHVDGGPVMHITHQGFDRSGEVYTADWWTTGGEYKSRWFRVSELEWIR